MNFNSYKEIEKKRLLKSFDYPAKLCSFLFEKYKMSEGMSLLDVGCGQGIQSSEFANLGLKVCGVDHSKEVQFKNFEYRKIDIQNNILPYPDNSFDVVFSKSVIEHIIDPSCFLRECKRVLKPAGVLILLTPDWVTQKENFYDDPTHVHPYTRKSLRMILEMEGFYNPSSEKFIQLPFVWRFPFLRHLTNLIFLLPYCIFNIFQSIKLVRFSRHKMILGSARKNESNRKI